MTPKQLSELIDRQQITEVVFRYCRAVDRRDFDLLRTCYHPDAIDRHTGFTGDIEAYIAWLSEILRRFAGTHHLIGQQLVELDGDAARCESYGTATHRAVLGGEPDHDFTTGFRYIDRMERRSGQWRIAERLATRDWTRSDAGLFRHKEGEGPSGHPSSADPLYRLPGWPSAVER